MTPERLAAVRERADKVKGLAHGSSALSTALASAVDVPGLLAEVERLAEHSKTLNAVAFRLAEALGDIPHGQEWTEGNPVELAERLTAERDEMRAVIRQAFGAGDDAWTVVANSRWVR